MAVDLPVRRHLHSWCTNGLSMQGKVATRGSADLGTAKGGGGGPSTEGLGAGIGDERGSAACILHPQRRAGYAAPRRRPHPTARSTGCCR